MPNPNQLTRDFYARPTLQVARELLGKRLVRVDRDSRLSGVIVETEAYIGQEDQGCHARSGLSERNRVMFGPPGHAYVYFTYGMHWLLNCVTEAEGFPAAVLLRAIVPVEGVEIIAERRSSQPPRRWTDGPAKLTLALGVDKQHNGSDLCDPNGVLFIERGRAIPDESVTTRPRVGLYTVPEPWKSIPWRFLADPAALPEYQALRRTRWD